MMLRKKKKIGITGPYSDINFGDYAILINNIYDISFEKLNVFAYDANFCKKIISEYCSTQNIDIFEVQPSSNIKHLMEKECNWVPLEVEDYIENYQDLEEKIREIDILIVSGGGYLNELWCLPHRRLKMLSILVPAIIAYKLNIQVIFSGNGYGPFGVNREFFSVLLNFFRSCTFGCRDDLLSPIWMQSIGVSKTALKIVPDDLFFINEAIKTKLCKLPKPVKKYVLLETYQTINEITDMIDVYRTFVENMSEKGLIVKVLPFNIGNGGLEQARFLKRELGIQFYDISDLGYLPIQDAVHLIREAELFVTMRYHGFLLSIAENTPVIAIIREVMKNRSYYYNKDLGVLNQVFGETARYEDVFLSTEMSKALINASENFSDIVSAQKKIYLNIEDWRLEQMKRARFELLGEILSLGENE